MKLPRHIHIDIEHNEHKTNYESAQKYLEDNEELYTWKDEESKQRAIAADDMWTIQWYPSSPVSFYAVAAPTLEEAIELALSIEAGEGVGLEPKP